MVLSQIRVSGSWEVGVLGRRFNVRGSADGTDRDLGSGLVDNQSQTTTLGDALPYRLGTTLGNSLSKPKQL